MIDGGKIQNVDLQNILIIPSVFHVVVITHKTPIDNYRSRNDPGYHMHHKETTESSSSASKNLFHSSQRPRTLRKERNGYEGAKEAQRNQFVTLNFLASAAPVFLLLLLINCR